MSLIIILFLSFSIVLYNVLKMLIMISVSTDISVFEFYRYIEYIRNISMDIFTWISIYQKLNCYNQSITIGSYQDFKYGHLNISPIYLRYFIKKFK